jgi:hypothetical protein
MGFGGDWKSVAIFGRDYKSRPADMKPIEQSKLVF